MKLNLSEVLLFKSYTFFGKSLQHITSRNQHTADQMLAAILPLLAVHMSSYSLMYLGIDTATAYLCLGLWSEQLEARLELKVERDHSKRILVELEAFLDNYGVHKKDLKGIAVGLGPGSYTGIRVGIAVAKGLARGLGLPLGGRSSLAALAYRALSDRETAMIALDAGRQQLYYGVFQKQGHSIIEIDKISKASRELARQSLSNFTCYEPLIPDALYLARSAKEPFQALEALYL